MCGSPRQRGHRSTVYRAHAQQLLPLPRPVEHPQLYNLRLHTCLISEVYAALVVTLISTALSRIAQEHEERDAAVKMLQLYHVGGMQRIGSTVQGSLSHRLPVLPVT